MKAVYRCFATAFTAGGIGACILVAPVAGAAPECTDIGPNTTQCRTNGSSQIVTSPPAQTNPYWGWPWGGGLVIGLGDGHR
ncbi:hypothetical protein AU193_17405 [Mycobacterium sp. GA-1285]|uniref:hypothetical protein n=1 Tax=Mycobacterium sp. GA-1285 TaxID=1772282 RepID=UPI000749C66E|nr:hypothetical protein [Mycobacterium sp. GA-1285]KUI20301.1 hypothetical protein AU193_17405 [Mycobacterium sp. GA-1285]